MAICGVIACAESWEDIALYAKSKEGWLRSFLTLKHGVPSHDTFRRVFMLIDPHQFEQCFRHWIGQWLGTNQVGHVAIDGKTVRHSFDRKREQSPLHLVSAWESRAPTGVRAGSGGQQIQRDHRHSCSARGFGSLRWAGHHRRCRLPESHHPGDSRPARRLCAHRERESATHLARGGNLVLGACLCRAGFFEARAGCL